MDKILENALALETKRQADNIELIASENYVSDNILKLQGSILTNKYAEGYPGKRYYGGCQYIDIFENQAILYAQKLFNCKYANVQPHSGSAANMAVYRALLNPGDKVMGMNLSDGGHLTHGHPLNFSGKDYEIIFYSVDSQTEMIDYEAVKNLAIKEKPNMIIAGASAYSRTIDFQKFREIADSCNAYLMVDMAHIAGLIATNLHPSPFPYADVVTSTTHKTLRGPRGGLILTNHEELMKKINKVIFPGIQGGPLMHVIGAKAVCFYEALQDSYQIYMEQVLKNIQALTNTLKAKNVRIISGGTDNHLILVDVKTSYGCTGLEAEKALDEINITVNKNTIPNDSEAPMTTSGIRIGSPAMTTRGLKESDFVEIGDIIHTLLSDINNESLKPVLKARVLTLTSKYKMESSINND